MLSANPLNYGIDDAVDGTQMQFTVSGGSGSSVLGLRVSSPDGSMNPAAPWIENVNGSIAPIYAVHNLPGSTDSLLLAELGPGTYTVTINTEGGTEGQCRLDVFLPGDANNDGMVSSQEYTQASAASVQNDGYWNTYTARYYSSLGFNLNTNWYDADLDVNSDGHIDGFDLGHISPNVGVPRITNVTIDTDITGPELEVGLETDSGLYNDDDITNQFGITGQIKDLDELTALTLSIDGATPVDIFGDLADDGTFSLSEERLEELNLGDMIDGDHSFVFVAWDDSDNDSTVIVDFMLDTVAPDKPATPDLTEDSDSGYLKYDNITNVNTPVFELDFEIGDYVTLSTDRYYEDAPTTHVIAEGELSNTLVTSSKLSDGKNIITYTITDLAGNVSEASDELEMIVDTYNPAVVDLDLAADSDTGEAGDKITSETVVTLEGQSELEYYGQTYDATSIKFDQSTVKLKITLPDGTTRDVDADADGKFVLDNIDLNWNTNDFVVYAEDAAGNVAESDFEVTFTQNNAPEVAGSIDRTIDNGFTTYSVNLIESGLFKDADIDLGEDDQLTITLISNTNTDLLTATLEKNEGDPAPDGYAYDYVLKLVIAEGQSGEAQILLNATDVVGQNASTFGVFTITVSDEPDDPIAVADSFETDEDSLVQNFNVKGNDYDPDDDPTDPDINDHITVTSCDATSDKGAAITLNADGTINYDPTGSYDLNALAEGETIEDTFTYTIKDENNGTATGTVTITVTGVNDAPVAVDDDGDDVKVDEDETLEIDVLANDVDSDTSDTLTVTEVRSEAEGVGKSEKGATITIQSDGTVLYDPTGVEGLSDLDPDETVTDTFKYDISDGHGGTDTGTVTVVITGKNDAPQYDGELEYTDEDTQFTIDLREHFSDEETNDDALIFTMVDDGNDCAAHLQADGHTVVIDPDANFNGMAFFQVKASDGNTTDSQETEARPILIFVRPINDQPVADDDTATVDADQTVAIDVLYNDTDADSDDILSLDEDDVVLSTGFEGTVTLVDGKFVFDPTGSDAFKQLKDGEQIVQTFTYTVQDNAEPTHTSDTATVTITITGVNDAPEQVASGIIIDEDTPKVIDLRTLISDAEAPTADFTGYVFTIDGVSNGSYDFDDDHTVTFTPDENYYGNEASIVFSVTDTANNDANKHTVQMTLPITVNSVNDLPEAEKALALDIEEDTTQDIDLRDYISDVETADDALIFFDVKDPLHGSAELLEDGHTVRFSTETEYQGPAEFKFSVEDADGASVEMTFTIEVTPVNDAPELDDGSQLVIDEENVLHVDLRTLVSDDETADDDLVFDAITATNGTAVMDNDGYTLHFTPGDISNGLGSFTFSVTDTGLGTADPKFSEFTINVEITPFNDPPEAEDTEVVDVAEDGSVIVDLRDRVQDVETADDDLIFSVNNSQSQYGTVVMIDDYQARFTPDGDYTGPASFEFSVTDTGDGTAEAKTVDMTVDVSVRPKNDAPVLDDDTPLVINEDVVLEFDLLTRVSDLETAGDDLTFEITGATGGTAVLDAVDGHTVYFTPDADYTGPASFTFTVTDTGEGTPPHDADPITETFTLDVAITPVNDAPVLDDDTPETTNEDTPVSIDLYDHVSDNFTPDEGLIFEIIGYTDGTAVMDDNEHVVHFTPGTNFVGTASLEFKVTDGGEGDDGPLSETFTLDIIVDPVNDAPQAEGSSVVSATEDTPIILDLRTKVSDLETGDDDLIFTLEHPDTPGGPTATITKEQGTFTLIENPNGNDYQVEFTPVADFYGAVNFSFWVTDTGEGTSDAISKNFLLVFDVAAVPDAPVANDETVDAAPDATTTIDVLNNCTDVDPDDVLSIAPGSLTPQAGFEGSISIVDNKIVFDPAGSQAIAELKDGEELVQTFTYTVQDSANPALTDTATVTLKIVGVNDAPQQVVTEIITAEDTPKIIDLWTLISDAETPDNDFTDYEFAVIAISSGTYFFDEPNHTVTFTPSANYHGYEASITFSVTDTAVDDANKQTKDFIVPITVTPMNDVPVPEDTDVIDVDEDGSVQINLRTRVEDVETDDADLSFSASNPQGGTLSWINGYTVEFTPTAGYNGPASFDFEVTDTGDGDGTGTGTPAKRGFEVGLNVKSINDAPIIDPNAPAIDADEDVTIDINLDDYFYDDETDDADLDFSNISATGGTAVLDGHIVHFTPTPKYAGAASITVDVTDEGDSTTDPNTETLTIDFTIKSIPDAPVAEDEAVDVAPDATSTIDVLANDYDDDPGDVISIDSIDTPTGFEGTLEIVDGKIVFDPTGSQAIAELKDGEDLVQTFTYTVKDSANPALTDTATVTLTITGVNDAPVQVASDITTDEDTSVEINLWTLISDAETPDNIFTDYEFAVTGVSEGSFDFDGDHTVTFMPSANYNGSDASITFSVTDTAVTDTNKQTVEGLVVPITVTSIDDMPVANDDANVEVPADAVSTINVLANDTDADAGQTETLTIVDSIVTEAGFLGTLTIVDNKIEFDPSGIDTFSQLLDGDEITQTFTYEVRDTDGNVSTTTATVTVKVIGVNDAPEALTVSAVTTPEETPVTFDLWDYFSDAEAPGGDFDGYAFEITGASNGSAVYNQIDHTVTFTPADDHNGPATVKFKVTDIATNPDNKQTTEITVNIDVTPVNDDPVANNDPLSGSTEVSDDQDTVLYVLNNDSDIDGDDLIITALGDTTGLDGQVTIAADSKSLIYTPSGSYNGPETFTYTISDGNGGTDTATVTLNVVGNQDPEPVNDVYNVTEDAVLNENVLDNDDDPDTGDTLTVTNVTFISGDLANFPPTVASDGSFSYTPPAVYNNLSVGETVQGIFEYTVQDPTGATATAQVTITVTGVNDVPTAGAGSRATDADSAITDGVLHTLVNETDTNDTLIYGLTSATSEEGATVTVNPSTGAWTYDPSAAADLIALGDGETVADTFTYTVNDQHGGEVQNTITITVTGVNNVPVATNGTAAVNANQTNGGGELSDLVDDPDTTDSLQYTLVGTAPLGNVQIDLNSGAWTYDPTGVSDFVALAAGVTAQDTFYYTVSDGHGGSDTKSVTITVTGVNDAPTAVADSGGTLNNGTVNINLIGNDTDPDTGATLSVTNIDTTGTNGAVTDNGDGTVTYDPSGWAAAQALASGAQLTDTFSYTVSDGQGGSDIATVTVTVTGASGNAAPQVDNPIVAVNVTDDGSTPADTRINLLNVFSDTDGDTLTFTIDDNNGHPSSNPDLVNVYIDGTDLVIEYEDYAANQNREPATVTVRASDITNNPGSPLTATDTFTITVDPIQTGSVQLVALSAPTSTEEFDFFTADATNDSQIGAARLQMDSDTTGPLSYSLRYLNVSGVDLDGTRTPSDSSDDVTTLTFRNNAGDIIFNILTDDDLQLDAAAGTVTGEWENIGSNTTGLYNGELFIYAETPAGNFKVSGNNIKPSAEILSLPTSLTEVTVGDTYVIEIWVQDYFALSTGLSGVIVDMQYDKAFSTATGTGTVLDTPFGVLYSAGSIDNISGEVSGIGGSTVFAGVGLDPAYVRLGYVEFTAKDATAVQEYTLNIQDYYRRGSSELDLSQIIVNGVSVEQKEQQKENVTFSVYSTSAVTIGGVCYGQVLEEQIAGSNLSPLTGTINTILQYDGTDEVSSIQFVDASVSATYDPYQDYEPGVEGVAGSALANVGLKGTVNPFNLALRNLVINIFSEQPIQIPTDGSFASSYIDQTSIDYTLSSGNFDVRNNNNDQGSRHSLSGKPLYESDIIPGFETPMGQIVKSGNSYTLTLPIEQFVDISDITGNPNDYLTFNISLNSIYTPNALTAAEASQTTVAADETELLMTLSKAATILDDNGQVDTLPISEGWIDEWDSYWVEIWARTGEGSGINAANLDLKYNGNYFTAVDVQHGRGLTENTSADISVDGIVSGLSGSAAVDSLGTDGFVMVGRVKFESLDGDQVPIDSLNRVIGPHDLGLKISDAVIDVEGVDESHIVLGAAPETELWAVPYDVDDNDVVDLGDLAFFAQSYQTNVLASDSSLVWASDYDKSGNVNLGDLSFFASNYRKAKDGDSDIAYPASFLQRWIGTGIEATGDSAIHEVLKAAVETWQQELGLDEPIDIQLVVKDFGTSQLGEGQILAVDENGRPTSGRITLDDDAAGIGWYSQLEGAPAEGKYDLYTVLLHEVGHTLGFMQQYDGFAENVESDGQGGQLFVGAGLDAQLDAAGQHLSAVAHPGDLMNSTLSPGIRRLPSDLSAQMILTAYDSATVGGGGFAAIGAAMNTEIAQPVTLTANTAATTDFSRVEGRLEGDVTWDRMFNGHDDRLNPSDHESVDQAVLDTVIDDISRADFNCDIPEVSEHIRLDAAGFAMHSHEDLSIAQPTAKKANGKNIFDAVFGDWDQPLG